MTDPGDALFTAALRLVGAPFRPHGRDTATGVDCLGLVTLALGAVGRPVRAPAGHTMHWQDLTAMDRAAAAAGLVPAGGAMRAGDVLLALAGPTHLHLMIAAHRDMAVHAHAGLRRVVLSAIPRDWPTVRHWRLASPS